MSWKFSVLALENCRIMAVLLLVLDKRWGLIRTIGEYLLDIEDVQRQMVGLGPHHTQPTQHENIIYGPLRASCHIPLAADPATTGLCSSSSYEPYSRWFCNPCYLIRDSRFPRCGSVLLSEWYIGFRGLVFGHYIHISDHFINKIYVININDS